MAQYFACDAVGLEKQENEELCQEFATPRRSPTPPSQARLRHVPAQGAEKRGGSPGSGQDDLDFGAELSSLCKHYGVEAAVLALQDGTSVNVLAKHGCDVDLKLRRDADGFEFFRHHVSRDLPIIISDARATRGLEGHPLVVGGPRIAFYAHVPLVAGPNEYAGTLSIFDSKPRPDFSLEDCKLLQQVASKMAEVVRDQAAGKKL